MDDASAAEPGNAGALRAFITETLAAWDVPGAAVAAVRDGAVVLCEGFGKRNVDAGLPVTPDTLFPVASCTKAFTALSVGLLVDEGRLAWDTPVREYLPTFRLHDPVASDRVTPRDLLCHRTGLPRHDMAWYGSNFTRHELFDRLRHLELSKDLRQSYQYNNLMFMVAGILVGKVSGAPSWEAFVRERLFGPLGMDRSHFSTVEAAKDSDHAQGYHEKDDALQPIAFFPSDGEENGVGPAGSILSTARDLASWLLLHLNKGRIGDRQLVAEATITETHRPQMVQPQPPPTTGKLGMQLPSYGLGWQVSAYKGRTLVDHGGNLDGFSSLVAFLPEANAGVAVLVNQQASYVPRILCLGLLDRLTDTEPTDAYPILRPVYEENKAAKKRGTSDSGAERVVNAPPSHPADDFLGEYEHPGYGVLAVERAPAGGSEGGDAPLRLVLNGKTSLPLTHYHYDVFEAYMAEYDSYTKVSFTTDVQGNVARLSALLEPSVPEIVFVRRPDGSLADPAVLSAYEGTYELMEMPIVVTLKEGGALTITLPGRGDVKMVPYRPGEFTLDGVPGVRIAFTPDAATGKAAELVQRAGGATYTAKRRE